MHRAVCVLLFAAAPLCAQRVLFQYMSPQPGRLGTNIRPAGDVDADGVIDFVATSPQNSQASSVQVVSGATGAVLLTIGGINPNHVGTLLDAVGIGDANGDGRSDIAVVADVELKLFSGANGQLLWSHPPLAPFPQCVAVSEAGDFDGNGRADLAVASYGNGLDQVQVLSGVNGAQLANITPITNSNSTGILRAVGDVNGDGRMDFAFAVPDRVHVLTTVPAVVAWTIVPTPTGDAGRTLTTVDLDGDGKREVIVGRPQLNAGAPNQGQIDVFAGDTGLLGYSLVRPPGQGGLGASVCGIGDLDSDGLPDLACTMNNNTASNPDFEVLVCSGRSGAVLSSFRGAPPWATPYTSLTDLGDVDHDGFHDVAVGCGSLFPGGGWFVLSGRILADVTWQSGACGGGPFLPQLGMTRPVLGSNVTITCRDGALGAWGTLVLSLQPTHSTYLGASTCSAWFDFGTATILFGVQQPSWSIQVPLPNVPQLAGIAVAMQCIYSPTAGPLGFDLSNGLWARFGF